MFVPDTPTWVGTTHRFYYRRSLANGFEFVMVDADTQQKQPAFDHARLADVAVARVGPRLPGHAAAVPELHLQRRAERDRDDHRRRALDLHARRLRVPHAGSAAARRDPPRHHRPGARRPVRGHAAAAHVARRQVDGVHRQLQRRDPPVRRRQAHGAQHRRLRRQLLRRRLDRLVAGFVEARRLSHPPRLSPPRALRRLVSGRSAAARALGDAVRQARRPARSRAAGAVRRPQPEADPDRFAPVPESVRHVRSGVAQGQPRLHASNTTSAATRCTASSKSTRRPAPRAR